MGWARGCERICWAACRVARVIEEKDWRRAMRAWDWALLFEEEEGGGGVGNAADGEGNRDRCRTEERGFGNGLDAFSTTSPAIESGLGLLCAGTGEWEFA